MCELHGTFGSLSPFFAYNHYFYNSNHHYRNYDYCIKKSGIINDAITQVGRKIVVNADLALELANKHKGNINVAVLLIPH